MKKFHLVVLAAAAMSIVACSESGVAPSDPQPSAASYGQGSTQDLAGTDTIRFSITIDPSRDTYYYLGAGNSITFPKGSLCDPNRSTYGAGQWDKACTAATVPLTINAKAWLDRKGNPRVDFSRDVRFVPSSDPSKWVVITFASMQAAMDPMFNILYCPQANSSCINEAKSDPSLVTVRNPFTGKVTRRIKHFSGYNVAAGEDAGLFDSAVGSAGANSISIDDFKYTNVEAVAAAFGLGAKDAQDMFDRIKFGRQLSGYILASGQQEQ